MSRANDDNPFRMPTDAEVFALRDEEQARKRAERELMLKQHVWEKGVKKKPPASDFKEELAEAARAAAAQQSKLNMVAAATRDRRKEKENMADFIAKKREMFLVQMSLDTKRAEIRKLEERAQQREEALKKSEQMLEEDALRFDQFLKDNDAKAVQAIKKAEAETKAKTEKVQEIKKLNAQITQIKSEMSKCEEQLEDCRKYKGFLDKLTPQEWFEEQKQMRLNRKAEAWAVREATRRVVCAERAAVDAVEQVDAAAAARLEAERKAGQRRRGRKTEEEKATEAAEREAAIAKLTETLTIRYMKAGEAAARAAEPPDEPEAELMYFKEPQQLLDVFTSLEESNLFLIQNSQETEEALEELKSKLHETQARMDEETAGLSAQIEHLKEQLRVEQEKRWGLDLKGENKEAVVTQEKTLDELNRKVAEVYKAIFAEGDNSLGTLQMLTNIETQLEELLAIIDTMPRDEVEAAEKLKEKERRSRVREAKQAEAVRAQEERIQRSIRRSQEPVVKRTGKPIMFRSQLPQKKKEEKTDDDDKLNPEDDINFYINMA